MSSSIPKPKVRPGFRRRLRHFFLGPNPLHPGIWESRLSPLTFRRLVLDDIPQCLEIYKLNEPRRFPPGFVDKYEQSLRAQRTYVLVAESEGRIIATGAIAYGFKPQLAILSYGLVHPDQQGKGIGTALVLARLSLLSLQRPVHGVFIFAVEKSFVFYQRFGFGYFSEWTDEHGKKHPTGYLVFRDDQLRECRKLLVDHGISVPNDEDKIPFNERPE